VAIWVHVARAMDRSSATLFIHEEIEQCLFTPWDGGQSSRCTCSAFERTDPSLARVCLCLFFLVFEKLIDA
jgi:hypothetical protein